MILWSLYKLRIRESEQLKTVLEFYEMDIQKISMPNYQKLKTMVKEVQIRNSECETLTPSTGKSKQDQWSRVQRTQVALKEEKENVTSGKTKTSVRRETSAVSGMRVMIMRQNRHRKPLHPLSHQ